jgi:hypothetical protein
MVVWAFAALNISIIPFPVLTTAADDAAVTSSMPDVSPGIR